MNKFNDMFKIIDHKINDDEQPFIDMYIIMNSSEIFMSQKFSQFSIFGSLNKLTTLYYPFNYGRMYNYKNIEYDYYKYPNFIFSNKLNISLFKYNIIILNIS